MRKRKKQIAIVLMFSLILSLVSPKAAMAAFITDEAQEALNRINEIRLEAKNEGIVAIKGNSDSQFSNSQVANGNALKWSKSAIEMAKVRAEECEKNGKISHTRPDGSTAVNIVGTYSLENLAQAWGQKQTMLAAVNGWYSEKNAYLHHLRYLKGEETADTTEQWGHYSTMIANEFVSVGLGTVYYLGTTQYGYESITAGEFTNAVDYTDKYEEDAGSTEDPDGIHDIFTAKDSSKLEVFQARILNRLLYRDEVIDVSDIDISPTEITYSNGSNTLVGEYAAREIVRNNPLHSNISTMGFPEFTYKANGNVATVKFSYHPVWTKDFVKQVLAGYDDAMSLINKGDSDFAKILKLHDWIVKNVSYGMLKNTADYAVGALANKSAVCGGYAQCYQFLLSQSGIKSIYVAAQTQKEPHAWNLVQYEGHWFHVDCTWDRGVGLNPTVKHDYFMKSDEEFNENGAHTEDWKAPEKNYPQGNKCTIKNKFYSDNTEIAQDEQIQANPIELKHEYDTSQPYHWSETEHWGVCKAGVEIREQHQGNPCSVCHYEQVIECKHQWTEKKDEKNHWQECELCHEKQNEESHTAKAGWEKDETGHWNVCEKCGYEKLNEENHTWVEKNDETYHWKECEVCGYETSKAEHQGNPCSVCHYEQVIECKHQWTEKKDEKNHWQECELCHEKQNEESHTAKAGWEKDETGHWNVCEKCGYEKLNEANHTWVEKNDETYHWKECKVCGYETSKAEHQGNPCSVCHYEQVIECKHQWTEKKDEKNHWQECELCHEKQNEESHTAKAGWEKDETGHWNVCEKCGYEKLNEANHTWVEKNDETYHWKECEVCGYETSKAEHSVPSEDDKLVTESYTVGAGKNCVITCTRSFDTFVDILIDGAAVPKKFYTARSGSTIVEISQEYMNTLKKGTHTATFRYTDGNVEGTFEVLTSTNDSDKKDDEIKVPEKTEDKTTEPGKTENKTTESGKTENKTGVSGKTENKTGVSGKTENKTGVSGKIQDKTNVSVKTEGKIKESVKTGDSMNTFVFIVLAIISFFTICVLARRKDTNKVIRNKKK